MPYRVKDVPGPPRDGVPARIDFDALWDLAIRPALGRLGYQAVRGDADPSGVILHEMVERLALADLVLADVSVPNGNAYYEIGIRHVARDTDCVLMAADWSTPLFDLSQTSAIRYPLPDERVDDAQAASIGAVLEEAIPKLRGVRTPYHAIMQDTGDAKARSEAFRDYTDRLAAFQSGVREIRLQPTPELRRARLRELLERSQGAPMRIAAVVVELLTLVRDELGWDEVLELVAALPVETSALPFVVEQRILAQANAGDALRATAELETLIASRGGTPERHGILGGRYKRQWAAAVAARRAAGGARPSAEERRYLARAIAAYEAGFHLDFNDYYCSANLPLLLLARGADGDREQAALLDRFVRLQCERAVAMGTADEWLPFTLLGVAVRLGEIGEVERLVDRIVLEGAVAWRVASAWRDLEASVEGLADREVAAAIYTALGPLADPGAPTG